MTNEAAKARGKAAYEMTQWGSWSGLLSSGDHGAMFAVARDEITAMNARSNEYREALNKQARARTEEGRAKMEPVIASAKAALDLSKQTFAKAAFAAGAPPT